MLIAVTALTAMATFAQSRSDRKLSDFSENNVPRSGTAGRGQERMVL
jgi:hypothetical protein